MNDSCFLEINLWVYRIISISFLTLLILVGSCFAQNNLLDRVPELQETANKAIFGKLGCGFGTITLVTSRGDITVGIDSDPIHVFGKKIVVKDLLTLLEARAESNRTGKMNLMSGNIGSLAYVILITLAESKDPTVIPVIAQLLDDKNDRIQTLSVFTLFKLAESDNDLRKEIEKISFPKATVQRIKELPTWIKVKEES